MTTPEYPTKVESQKDVYIGGLSPTEVTKMYGAIAQEYHTKLVKGVLNGPLMVATEIANKFPKDQRQDLRIIDIAAGTGKAGVELREFGFQNIDALEPCQEMMDILSDTGAYVKKFVEYIGTEKTSIPDDTYDVVVIAGGMGDGHIPLEGLDEIIRITKRGGLVFNIMREEFLYGVEVYKDKLEPYMDLLEKKNLWKKEERKICPNYYIGKNGLLFIHRII